MARNIYFVHLGDLYTLIFGCLFVTNNVVSFHFKPSYIKVWNKCLPKQSAFSSRPYMTLEKCLTECSFSEKCLSVNFRRNYRLCELFTTDVTSEVVSNSIHNGPCINIKRSSFLNDIDHVCMMFL